MKKKDKISLKTIPMLMCITAISFSHYLPVFAGSSDRVEEVIIEESAGEALTPGIEENIAIAPAAIEVSISVNGDSVHGSDGHGNYERWIAPITMTMDEGQTVGDAIRRILEEQQYTYREEGDRIVALGPQGGSILENGITNGSNSGWAYSVDGKNVTENMNEYKMQNGDEILLYFNDDLDKKYHKPVDITFTLVGDTPHEEGKHEAYVLWLDRVKYTVDEGTQAREALDEAIRSYGYQTSHEEGEDYGIYSITTPDGITISSDDYQISSMWATQIVGSLITNITNHPIKEGDEFQIFYTHDEEKDYYLRLIDSIGDISVRSEAKIKKIRSVVDDAIFWAHRDDPELKKLCDAEKKLAKLKKQAFSISFKLIGDEKHRPGEHKEYKTWIKMADYQVSPGENALEVVQDILNDVPFYRGQSAHTSDWDQERLPFKSDGRNILSITNKDGIRLSNGTNGADSRWVCTVNGKVLRKSLVDYKLKKKDKLVLYYTDDTAASYPDGASHIKLNYSTLPLQVKQSTSVIKIKSSAIEGDVIKSAKSSKPSVASVKVSKGRMIITGRKAGTAQITVKSKNKGTATATVKVQKKKVILESISTAQNYYGIKRKTTKKIPVKKSPVTAQETLRWRSKNTKIATVNQKGEVTGVREGSTEIIAQSPSGLKIRVEVGIY